MNIIEQIKAEVERLKGICTAKIKANPGQTFPFVMEMTGYDKILSFLSTLESEKPVPNGLEEAAGDYASDSTGFIDMTAYRAFIAGAKWERMQMMKGAIEYEVGMHGEPITINLDKYVQRARGIFPGEKVRIIIVKED